MLALALVALSPWSLRAADASPPPVRGLPLMRFYPFDDIGDVARGAHLLFDPVGRLTVVQDGVCLTLNDAVWLPVAIESSDGIRVQRVVCDADGTFYYGALGSWGILAPTGHGTLKTTPLTPADRPGWAVTSNFSDILCRPEGICFVADRGLVYRDRVTQKSTYIEIPSVAHAFALKDRIYVSSHSLGTLLLEPDRGTFHEADRGLFENFVIDHVAPLADGRAVVTTTGRRLLLLDGDRLTSLNTSLGERFPARITALRTLPEGNVAAAVNGHGLYVITPDGNIVTALTQPEYRSVSALAVNEAGVLWASTESGVAKILYGAPVTTFGQALGLPIGWPQIVSWEGTIVTASNGRVYEPEPGLAGEPVRFRLMPNQPVAGTWGIASWREWLLLANAEGVFGARRGERFQKIFGGVGRLAMLGDVCIAIGSTEISALRLDGDTWRECAARVPGIGSPSIVHVSDHAVWLELGANRAGRIALVDGRIVTRIFETFPWREPHWIHVSIVDADAVLVGPDERRIFLDEKTGEPVERPALSAVLDQAPFPAARICKDESGRLWISHAHGVFTLTPRPGGYEADIGTYRLIAEHRPLVQPLPGGVWISSARSLYHAVSVPSRAFPLQTRPRLVSVRVAGTNRELIDPASPAPVELHLPYAQNSLAFRFFAGSYASRRTPDYEFHLNDGPWTSLDSSAVLRLSDLREGAYRLAIRLVDESGPVGHGAAVNFSIAPPWQRTWYALTGYLLLGGAAVYGLVRLLLLRARARNAALERIVAERTEELKSTMQQLQRETRTAATLAERNRLASEIHDSLEQGFSGLVLHLDTTASLADCPPPILSALTVARNMVAFSRNEVRHAVWDLHSPLLEEGDLAAGLQRLVSQSVPEPSRASVSIEGQPRPLGSAREHHLLRIAQEAIANAVKHARAEHLEVKLVYAATEVLLTIRDDGCGFDPKAVMAGQQNGHFGLRSLRGRATKIGATLEIASTPGDGTRVIVRLPGAVELS